VKVVKPLKLGVLYRTFEHRRRFFFTPSVMVHFSLEHPSIALQDAVVWASIVEDLGKEAVFDEGMPKATGELLVTARAYPPGGDAPVCAVRVGLGTIDKRLVAVGDRVWRRGVPTEPAPFRELPLTWANAFGGAGHEPNPQGKGASLVRRDGKDVQPLPNVEHPDHLVTSPSQRPPAVGFGALDTTRPERRARAGTYDSRWLAESFPGLPEDIDWRSFNVAPEDQWLPDFFRGDEAFVLENLHPERATIEARITDLVARAFVASRSSFDAGAASDALVEVPLRLDTLHVVPHRMRATAIFRGVLEVYEDDAHDLGVLLVGCDRRGSERPIDHYRSALARRLDRKRGHLHALREADLMPPRHPAIPLVAGEALADAKGELATEGLAEANQRRRAGTELERLRADLAREGVDPSAHQLPPEPPPPLDVPDDPDALAVALDDQLDQAEAAEGDAARRVEAAVAEARKDCERAGVNYDALVAEKASEQGGPPTFRASEELRKLRDMVELGRNAGVPMVEAEAKLADPEYPRRLEFAEHNVMTAYRRYGHLFPPARALGAEANARVRGEVEAAVLSGVSLAGRDLTGADLAGLSLVGADLRGAFLEGARLVGCDLGQADLTDAVLVRADLTDATLEGARVRGANLGEATLVRTELSDLDLTGVTFAKSRCVELRLRGARLEGNDCLDATFERCDFRGIKARAVQLIGAAERPIELSGSCFAEALLEEVSFLHVRLVGANFRGATLRESLLTAVHADDADFTGADATNLRVVHGSSLARASFVGATLTKANLRATNLCGACFDDATLEGAELGEANLEGASLLRIRAPRASLARANLRGAVLAGANLMEGLLPNADLSGADLRGANLFRASLARCRVSAETRLDDANLSYALYVEARADGP